ncbi:MAG TPA: hypothetical protein VFB21_12700 [Chthonomonadaceae bacterium]|nr:hypothetical protein [Chthonomonadaceae bacterium]
MNNVATMRRLIVLCPLLTAIIACSSVGYQVYRYTTLHAKEKRLLAEYKKLSAPYHQVAHNLEIHAHHDHDDHDHDAD